MLGENQRFNGGSWVSQLLRLVNLRVEESERTILMFAFYTFTSVGLSWLEASIYALFLGEYGAHTLPLIYIANAVIGIALGFIYSWMQRVLPLRRVIVLVSLLIALPLLIFRFGLNVSDGSTLAGLSIFSGTVLMLRLWVEAVYVLNDLNASITANQIFNIREIKRTFPLINSGILVADIISGFSLPVFLDVLKFGLPNVILIASLAIAMGAAILFYLTQAYQQFFPDSRRRLLGEGQLELSQPKLQQPVRQYLWLLFAFLVMVQALYLLVDFQFFSQLEAQEQLRQIAIGGFAGFAGVTQLANSTSRIASFLGLFQGVLGICELTTQWFASSRLIEWLGVFFALLLLPIAALALGSLLLVGWLPLFFGFLFLRFIDEWIRYTLLNSSSPVLFQPLPENMRSNLQALVRGIAEPVSSGIMGMIMVGILWSSVSYSLERQLFLGMIIVCSIVWILTIWLLRARYIGLLVMGAERGKLSVSDVDLRELKRAVIEALNRSGTIEEKRSCIELLSHIDPQNVGDVLAPLLTSLPPELQRQSLDVMMNHPSPTYLSYVRELSKQSPPPEVLAMSLRYIWLTETDDEWDIRALRVYMGPEVDPVVRGTAASLVLRRGTSKNKAEATNTLRQMLTHKRERERVMGCRALGEAVYMQALRLYIPSLLQDESLRVRCALLEAISATQLEEYYPSLLKGLAYKSTQEAAMRALVRLENEALNQTKLVELAEDVRKPEPVRLKAWETIGRIGTQEARKILVAHLMTAWGGNRRNIVNILLKIPQEMGINAVLDRLGRSGVENLIEQELLFMGQLYAGLIDISAEKVPGLESDLLRRALKDTANDALSIVFPLLKLLYQNEAIQAAAFNLQSDSKTNVAMGLEILDNTLDIASKRILLVVMDARSDIEKLQSLAELTPYRPLSPSDRLRRLLELRYFLPEWPLACCFHVARQARWSVTPDQTLACLRHPTGFVREAVLAYLKIASPRALKELLPKLQNDPDRLVASQAQQILREFNLGNSTGLIAGY